jgi:biopolymer transport protein ExbB
MSIVALAWTIHCLLAIRQSQVLPERVRLAVLRHISIGDISGAMDVCEKSECVLSRVTMAGLRKAGADPGLARDAVQAAGAREAARLQQKISYLSNIGVIAPMLGLLGTVWGMIIAFQSQAGATERFSQTPILMAAVSTAMNTTAAGLVVGIPAMAFYFYLRGRVVKLVTDLEVAAEEAIHAVEHRRTTV